MENTYNNQNENTDNEISLRKYINILISEKTFIIFITFLIIKEYKKWLKL